MFSFGRADRPQFGGVGVMVGTPGVELTISPAAHFSVEGDRAERVGAFVKAAAAAWGITAAPSCRIVVRSPQDHTGLGVGTQLGLAAAAGLRAFLGLPSIPVELLAESVGRGGRSAVGMYGFERGGLIVEEGRRPAEASSSRLVEQVPIPESWRFVLVRPLNAAGLAGEPESAAFSQLPPVPDAVTNELWRIAGAQLLPAVKAADCSAFGEAVYRFGWLSGECFSAAQGGPFASARIAELVDKIRGYGVPGVGQSSWGPTVFAITASEKEAGELVRWLERGLATDCEMWIAGPNNTGAIIEQR
jgi:beta-ribofuranosylaminobenzene 5'-phosphate synthase